MRVSDILRSYRAIDFAGEWWYHKDTKGDDQWSAQEVNGFIRRTVTWQSGGSAFLL